MNELYLELKSFFDSHGITLNKKVIQRDFIKKDLFMLSQEKIVINCYSIGEVFDFYKRYLEEMKGGYKDK